MPPPSRIYQKLELARIPGRWEVRREVGRAIKQRLSSGSWIAAEKGTHHLAEGATPPPLSLSFTALLAAVLGRRE